MDKNKWIACCKLRGGWVGMSGYLYIWNGQTQQVRNPPEIPQLSKNILAGEEAAFPLCIKICFHIFLILLIM